MPVKNNVILYESFASAGMIDSPYAIFLEFLRDKRFDDYLIVKLSKQLKQQAIERAESKYSTLSDYLRGLIVKDLEERK